MLSQGTSTETLQIQIWPIDRLVFYARNPRKNDAAVDRMCSSIREFGFKIPVLARSDGEVVDGHLRLKAARKLGSWPGGDTSQIPVILCDEWTRGAGEGVPLDGESLRDVGRLGRRAAGAGIAGTQRGGLRSQPDRLRSRRDRRPAGDSRTRSAPTPRRPFPRIRCPAPAICGSAESTACSAGTPPARKMSPGCSASASRS